MTKHLKQVINLALLQWRTFPVICMVEIVISLLKLIVQVGKLPCKVKALICKLTICIYQEREVSVYHSSVMEVWYTVLFVFWLLLGLFTWVGFNSSWFVAHLFFVANRILEDTSSHHWGNSGTKTQTQQEIYHGAEVSALFHSALTPLISPQLQINYDRNLGNLIVHVLQARNLAPRDNDSYSDPFVKVYLLPGRGWAPSLSVSSRMSGLCLPFLLLCLSCFLSRFFLTL